MHDLDYYADNHPEYFPFLKRFDDGRFAYYEDLTFGRGRVNLSRNHEPLFVEEFYWYENQIAAVAALLLWNGTGLCSLEGCTRYMKDRNTVYPNTKIP